MQDKNPSFVWPDPRGKWPETAKAMLKQVLIRGRPNREEINNNNSNTMNTAPPSSSPLINPRSSTSAFPSDSSPPILFNTGLTMGSSNYNFATKSISSLATATTATTTAKPKINIGSEHPTASVAAFLSFAATSLSLLPSRKSGDSTSNSSRHENYQDECALMFLADVLEVSCGPGGVASINLNFPSSDPGGLNFFRNYAAANGARVENVNNFLHGGGMNQTTAAALQQLTTGNNNNAINLSNSSDVSNNHLQQQMAVSSSICILREGGNSSSNGSAIVVDRCGPDAQSQAMLYSQQQQQQQNKNIASGTRRQRSNNNNNQQSALSSVSTTSTSLGEQSDVKNNNPTSALFGYFASSTACSSCPHENLKALLCRRPTLHQLPCCVLLILFASLRNILDQYDSLREHDPALKPKSKQFVGIINPTKDGVKQEEGGAVADDDSKFTNLSARSLPSGIPFAMKLFCGDSLDCENYPWEWLWVRVTLINKLLNEGMESFAKVV